MVWQKENSEITNGGFSLTKENLNKLISTRNTLLNEKYVFAEEAKNSFAPSYIHIFLNNNKKIFQINV